jgi:CheY-like chemotaxis protein
MNHIDVYMNSDVAAHLPQPTMNGPDATKLIKQLDFRSIVIGGLRYYSSSSSFLSSFLYLLIFIFLDFLSSPSSVFFLFSSFPGVTGNAAASEASFFKAHGATTVLVKPFNKAAVIAELLANPPKVRSDMT